MLERGHVYIPWNGSVCAEAYLTLIQDVYYCTYRKWPRWQNLGTILSLAWPEISGVTEMRTKLWKLWTDINNAI